MGEIKTALELALERTEGIAGDKKTLEAHENKTIGKRLVSQISSDPDFDLKKELKKYSADQIRGIRDGMYSVLITFVALPAGEDDLSRFSVVKKGIQHIVRDPKAATNVLEQTEELMRRYLESKTQLVEALRKQFEPRLRKREEELARQYGHAVKIDPASDPEFNKVLQSHLGNLQNQYEDVLDQVRAELTRLFEDWR